MIFFQICALLDNVDVKIYEASRLRMVFLFAFSVYVIYAYLWCAERFCHGFHGGKYHIGLIVSRRSLQMMVASSYDPSLTAQKRPEPS